MALAEVMSSWVSNVRSPVAMVIVADLILADMQPRGTLPPVVATRMDSQIGQAYLGTRQIAQQILGAEPGDQLALRHLLIVVHQHRGQRVCSLQPPMLGRASQRRIFRIS